jgi:hypothetical protein
MKTLLLAVFLVLTLPVYSNAEMYKYIDEKGTTHFTDNFGCIPEKYKEQIKTGSDKGTARKELVFEKDTQVPQTNMEKDNNIDLQSGNK